MDLEQIYRGAGAYLQGHFLLSSGNHSEFYLQSAKVLEDPRLAGRLADELAAIIEKAGVEFDSVCSPALGGILAGYELARAAKKRFIFTERVDRVMSLRRGFEVHKGERFIVCEDIVTTGGSALESARLIENLGGEVVGFAALANRGFCKVANLADSSAKSGAK
ncbi:MAG: orotate phosphoribosyltransferase, partial [Campylobacter sp.]|nr:orotate phosphoribosyltransferase [Campylobacter sp.]